MVSAKNKRRLDIFYFTVFIVFISLLFAIFFYYFKEFFPDIDKLKNFILSFGLFAPIIFIILQIGQVLLAPIPGQLTGLLGGFLFGVAKGTLYSTTGAVIGTLLSIVLVRKFGKPFVKKVVDKKTFNKFDKFFEKRGTLTLFLIYLLPFFPDDIINFIAGLSKLKTKEIVLIAFIGRLPGIFVLSLIGAGFSNYQANFVYLLLGILSLISFTVYYYRNILEEKMIKILNNLKK